MRKITLSLGALVLGVALASTSAFAQVGPAGPNYGAGSTPLTGGPISPPASPGSVAPNRLNGLYNFVPQQPQQQNLGPAGPAGANFGAGSNPQTGR